MRSITKVLPELFDQIEKRGFVLMCDFDGTLSPIVPHHRSAKISSRAKRALTMLSRTHPVAVISGRGVFDVRRKVGLANITYAGCHGLELLMHAQFEATAVAPATARAFAAAKQELSDIASHVPGTTLENKGLSFAMHYRHVPTAKRAALRREIRAFCSQLPESVRALDDLYTLDIIPNGRGAKGKIAKRIFSALRHKPGAIALYIGDGKTDEDAFRAFPRGFTIRVGKTTGSAANYYLAARSDVDDLLEQLASLTRPN